MVFEQLRGNDESDTNSQQYDGINLRQWDKSAF